MKNFTQLKKTTALAVLNRICTRVLIMGLICLPTILSGQYNFTLTGSATHLSDLHYRLTPPTQYQAGALWSNDPIDLNQPFEIEFYTMFGHLDGADGMAFVFQNESDPVITPPLGGNAQNIGFGNGSGNPIDYSVAIEFDTYYNSGLTVDMTNGTSEVDHIDIFKNGVFVNGWQSASLIGGPVQASPTSVNIEDGACHKVKIVWTPDNTTPANSNLKVYFDDDLRVDVTLDVRAYVNNGGSTIGWWGVTGSTGTQYNNQRVTFVEHTEEVICPGSCATLGEGIIEDPVLDYWWTNDAGYEANEVSPQVCPTEKTTYTLLAYDYFLACPYVRETEVIIDCCCDRCGKNLVVNGDFSNPICFTQYSSDFFYHDCNTVVGLGSQGFTETADASVWNPNWEGIDHTGNGSRVMLLDGPAGSNPDDARAWYQFVNVEQGKQYCFSAWVKNAMDSYNGNRPGFELRIGGLTGQLIGSAYTVDVEDGWVQICGNFIATATGPLELDIVMLRTPSPFYNDALIDDIALYRVGECTCCDLAEVTVIPDFLNPFSCEGNIVVDLPEDCEIDHIMVDGPITNMLYDAPTNTWTISYMIPPGYGSTIYTIYFKNAQGEVICSKQLLIDCFHQPDPFKIIDDGKNNPDNNLGKQLTLIKLSCYPNPAIDKQTTVNYFISEPAFVKLELMDYTGKQIIKLEAGQKLEGNHSVNLETGNLAEGIYLVRMEVGNKVEMQKLVINK